MTVNKNHNLFIAVALEGGGLVEINCTVYSVRRVKKSFFTPARGRVAAGVYVRLHGELERVAAGVWRTILVTQPRHPNEGVVYFIPQGTIPRYIRG
jgi:hypothetical protein